MIRLLLYYFCCGIIANPDIKTEELPGTAGEIKVPSNNYYYRRKRLVLTRRTGSLDLPQTRTLMYREGRDVSPTSGSGS